MAWKPLAVLLVWGYLSPGLWAQRPPPIQRPPPVMRMPGAPESAGIPVPGWLGKGKTITGNIAGIDPDRMLVRSFDYGNVLFFVDEKTIVRVDKIRLSLADLREGDPVAVRLKEIKDKGPYATEILPHPDVRRRKERGEEPPRPAESETAPDVAPAAPMPKPAPDLPEPALPEGRKGITGAVTEVRDDLVTVQARDGKSRKVMVTSVTRILRAGTDQVLSEVRAGDRVAVVGDTLDTGMMIAREVLVNRSAESAAAVASAGGEFAGTIAAIDGDTILVRTPEGQERKVLVTGVTIVRRWGADVPFSALRKGDQVTVAGDVLEGGLTLARQINVTKPATSR